MNKGFLLTSIGLLAAALAPAVAADAPDAQRREALVRMVRQDCGSCHGMRLTGGLGPPLTPDALAGKPEAAMAATIFGGRAGTAMPPWRALLTEAEALWIARTLAAGFPLEKAR